MKILLGIVYCEIPCWTLVFFMYVVRFACLCTGIERPEVLIKFLPQTISFFFGNRFSLNLILPIQIDWLAGKPKIVKIWHHKCVLSASSFFMNAGILTYVLILEAQTLLRENILSPIVTLNDINFLYSISILSFYFLDGMIPEVTLAAFHPDGVYHKMSVEAWMCREGF